MATLSHEDFFKILKKNGRFEAVVEVGRLAELTDLGLPYRIVKLLALQGHEQNLVDASDPEGNMMTLDPNYSIASYACGKHPKEPKVPHLCGRRIRITAPAKTMSTPSFRWDSSRGDSGPEKLICTPLQVPQRRILEQGRIC